jgi:hypothetical protein
MLLAWLLVAVAMHNAEERTHIEFIFDQLVRTLRMLMFVSVMVLGLPVLASEARNRTLMLHLLQPIERTTYYTGRVGGRALFAASYFAVTIGGILLVLKLVIGESLASGRSPVPPDTTWTLVFTGLSLVTMTSSLAALAPVSTARYGHLAYWAGLYAMLWQARALEEVGRASAVSRAFAWLTREIVGPFLMGPSPQFTDEVSLGGWHLSRALLQWGFGLALAYLVGVSAFSRMEVGRRL